MQMNRRQFLRGIVGTAAAGFWVAGASCSQRPRKGGKMRFGLVTYQWGRDLDLPTLLRVCEQAGYGGVELRVDHKHGVSPQLNAAQRAEVRKRFADSPVVCVGLGTNERFDSPDPAELQANIERTKAWLQLSHDIGASGVKVKPNDLHPNVPKEKTIEQIGKALRELAQFGANLGQQLRLEVHGSCKPLPIIRKIMEVADHPNVRVCWNCNREDLSGEGLEYNFWLVKSYLGDTLHVHELDRGEYPYDRLLELLVNMDYEGWVLLEAGSMPPPKDRVAALKKQRRLFEQLRRRAQAVLG